MEGKTVIFGILEREGKVITQVIPAATKDNVERIIKDRIIPDSKIYSDNSKIYNYLKNDYVHDTVNHVEREWVRGDCHVQSLECYWNLVKRTIKGTHVHVSLTHIQKYLDEISFRWQHRNNQDKMFDAILSRVV